MMFDYVSMCLVWVLSSVARGNTRTWCWNSGKENKKGKNIVVKEDKHVCPLVFHMLQDLINRNG
jgi:hypothetical protein